MATAVVSDLQHLRRPDTKEHLVARSAIRAAARRDLEDLGFLEIDTPVLGQRMQEYPAGHFRVLQADGPDLWLMQSPQVFKQAVIASGIERYFQFAHCFRDNDREPGRKDYLREFVQLDIEMRATTIVDVIEVAETVVRSMFGTVGLPLPASPFPLLDHADAIECHGSDRPDLREGEGEMSCLWVTNFPLASRSKEGGIILERHPMALPHMLPASPDDLVRTRSHSFDLVINGYEIASGDLRISDPAWQRKVLELADLDPRDFADLLTVLEDCPPHGGFGIGFDRICMQLLRADSVGEISAFPDGFGA